MLESALEGLAAIGASILQLIPGSAFAVRAICVALRIQVHLIKKIDEFQEIAIGIVAVALEIARVIIAVAVIIQSGVLGIPAALMKSLHFLSRISIPVMRNYHCGKSCQHSLPDQNHEIRKYVRPARFS